MGTHAVNYMGRTRAGAFPTDAGNSDGVRPKLVSRPIATSNLPGGSRHRGRSGIDSRWTRRHRTNFSITGKVFGHTTGTDPAAHSARRWRDVFSPFSAFSATLSDRRDRSVVGAWVRSGLASRTSHQPGRRRALTHRTDHPGTRHAAAAWDRVGRTGDAPARSRCLRRLRSPEADWKRPGFTPAFLRSARRKGFQLNTRAFDCI